MMILWNTKALHSIQAFDHRGIAACNAEIGILVIGPLT